MLIGFTGFESIEDDARKKPIPYLLTGGGLVEEIDSHDLFSNGDGNTRSSIDVLQLLSIRTDAISVGVKGVRHRCAGRFNSMSGVKASDFLPDFTLI